MDARMIILALLTQGFGLALSIPPTCHIRYDPTLDGDVAACGLGNLTSVPQNLPPDIVGLQIEQNLDFKKITNGSFVLYRALKSLILWNNLIKDVEKDAFHGLNQLVVFTFGPVPLNKYTFPLGIPFKNLKVLNLKGSRQDGLDFPCFIFLYLKQLTMLSIDASPWSNPNKCTELRNLKNLKSFTMQSCTQFILKNDSFIEQEWLPLQNLILHGILHLNEKCIFCPLKSLKYLQIGTRPKSNITLKDVTWFIYGLTNRSSVIDVIDLHQVQDTQGANFDSTLDRQVMGYLPWICAKRLDLSNNRLMVIKADTFLANDSLSMCIAHLDLSKNYIHFDFDSLCQMGSMMNLTILDLSQNTKRFPKQGDLCISQQPCYQCSRRRTILTDAINVSNIDLPPKLELLNLSNSFLLVFVGNCNIFVKHGEYLQVLDLSNNGVLYIYPFLKGLANISYLDISGMNVIDDTFNSTDLFTNVEILIARRTNIEPSPVIYQHSAVNIIFMMTKLKSLDLSENSFRVIHKRTFSRLVNVVNLSLSRNQLSYISEELLSMPSLTSLDLSFNSINIIGRSEREILDEKLEQTESFYLNIYGNTIACTCRTLCFVKWLHETRISLENKGNYSCLTDYGTLTFTTQFYYNFLLHWRRCVGQFWLTVAFSLQLGIITCLMSAFLLKKYFPKVEHHILQWLGMLEPRRWDYEYDAYICYGNKDYQWPCHYLYKKLLKRDETVKLYVPDLHDPFGEVKAEVIHDAIQKSWKLIIVVTEDLFTDEWSHFKVLEALRLFSQDGVITSRILLLYQDISPEAKDRVPNVLLNVVPRKNILEVDPGDDFWTELHQMIIREDMDMEILF